MFFRKNFQNCLGCSTIAAMLSFLSHLLLVLTQEKSKYNAEKMEARAKSRDAVANELMTAFEGDKRIAMEMAIQRSVAYKCAPARALCPQRTRLWSRMITCGSMRLQQLCSSQTRGPNKRIRSIKRHDACCLVGFPCYFPSHCVCISHVRLCIETFPLLRSASKRGGRVQTRLSGPHTF